jgi:hypothetical protein
MVLDLIKLNLVSYVHSSIIASDKIKSAQLQLSRSFTALKLVSDCKPGGGLHIL